MAAAKQKRQGKAKGPHAKTTPDATPERYPLSDEYVHPLDDGMSRSYPNYFYTY